eukprot:scaffold130646_cov43-Attheya_sp.AAC.3
MAQYEITPKRSRLTRAKDYEYSYLCSSSCKNEKSPYILSRLSYKYYCCHVVTKSVESLIEMVSKSLQIASHPCVNNYASTYDTTTFC